MHGLHLTADLYGCRCERALLTDAAQLATWCRSLVRAAGLVAVDERWFGFPDSAPPGVAPERGGVTGVVLLAESHFAVHTWPERGGVTLDVYVCNLAQDNSARADRLMQQAIAGFGPKRAVTHRLIRGDLGAAVTPA